jgi:EipB-like
MVGTVMARFVSLTAAMLAVVATASPSVHAAPADGVVLAPHLAFYNLKLARTNGNRGISGVQGRILYDFSGNACEGYELKFRQVSELNSVETNNALSDLTSTTWEDGEAKRFRFSSENKINQQVTDIVAGRAERGKDAVAVTLQKPSAKNLRVPAEAVFPTEHMRRIIAAARSGKKVLDLVVYDGSETGEKLYNTLTVIGRGIASGEKDPADAAAKSTELAKLTRWPVTVSYFERKDDSRTGEQEPVYSINFELYENGISRALMLNYSDFSISGELTSLEMRKAKSCP